MTVMIRNRADIETGSGEVPAPVDQGPRTVGGYSFEAAIPAIRRTRPITRQASTVAPSRSALISSSTSRLNKNESCRLDDGGTSSERTMISLRIKGHDIEGDQFGICLFPAYSSAITLSLGRHIDHNPDQL